MNWDSSSSSSDESDSPQRTVAMLPKFEWFNNKYLKPVLVRSKDMKTRGLSILNVFQKLNEKDMREYLERNGSSLFCSRPFGSSPSSIARLLASHTANSLDDDNDHDTSMLISDSKTCIPMPDTNSSTCLDMAALEVHHSRKMKDDSKIHHIIEDALFQPRKRFSRHRRHMLPDCEQHNQTFHHKARLHLRTLMSHQHHEHHQYGNGSLKAGGPNSTHSDGKPRKNVSFADMPVTEAIDDREAASTVAEVSIENSDSGSEGGIMFIAPPMIQIDDMTDKSSLPSPVSPVAVEKSLPWKRNTGREPMSSAFTHSLPDENLPQIGEAPSWVNNTEYTSPAVASSDLITEGGLLSIAPVSCDVTTDIPSEPYVVCATESMDDILLTVPESATHVMSPAPEPSDSQAAMTANFSTVALCGGSDGKSSDDGCALPLPWRCDADEIVPPHNVQQEHPVLSTIGSGQCESPGTWLFPNDRSEVMGHEDVPVVVERTDSIEPVPSSAPEVLEPEIATIKPEVREPPAPSEQPQEEEPPVTRAMSFLANLGQNELNGPVNGTDVSIPSATHSHRSSPEVSRQVSLEKSVSLKGRPQPLDSLPPPWRRHSNTDVSVDQHAPRPDHINIHNDDIDDNPSNIPPPPWRKNGSDATDPLRSPSASHELDAFSLKPQQSTQSFRLSEAESKHSGPYQMHHMIDIQPPRLITAADQDYEPTAIDVENDEDDFHARVNAWLDKNEEFLLKNSDETEHSDHEEEDEVFEADASTHLLCDDSSSQRGYQQSANHRDVRHAETAF